MARHVALLRGINVGGNNIIRMGDLKACLEDDGFQDVSTYIASGNVLFSAKPSATLGKRLEKLLAARFDYRATVMLRTLAQMQEIVGRAPAKFGDSPAKFRYDVIFLKPPVTAAAALKSVLLREGVDQADAGQDVLYFSRLISKATQSRMSRIVALPIYQSMTIRNWNTTTTLLRLLQE